MNAIDVANFFIDYNNHSIDDTITNLKLNKLLYFAQGYSLALYDKPLFNDEIKAWQYGPVVESVYHTFKSNHKENITNTFGRFSIDNFNSQIIELLLAVINDYGKYTSSTLVNITHEIGSPWEKIYSPENNNTISQESIKTYFKNLNITPLVNQSNLDKIEFIGKRDDISKPIILPSEYDDKEDYSIYLNEKNI